ncbi:MAG: electron transport complex subunit RsxB [Thiotrichales bacterium]
MLTAIASISLLSAFFGLVLGYSSIRFRVQGNPIVEQIDSILPQTQCGQCGYPGCHPYAEAIARGEADINRCPPGGQMVIVSLADLLGMDPKPLDEEVGEAIDVPQVAVILEQWCVGCTLCIQACPVDAIIGAAKQMHTVIAAECTGCKLCLPACPVDCIVMQTEPTPIEHWVWPYPEQRAITTPALAAESSGSSAG